MEKMNVGALVEKYFDDYKKDLATLISHDSVNAPPEDGAPFGKGVDGALRAMIAIADRMGFQTFRAADGHYGYADIGEGDVLFGVIGHLDVVPVGDPAKWEYPPFTMTEKDGYLYGRGSQDDKGPLLASMYALKILLDQGAKLNKRVRFIFGTDEESLWRGIKAYAEKEEHPSMGITPDADFPLIYAEQGLVEFTLTSNEKSDILFKGGTALNAVPAAATIAADEKLEAALADLEYGFEKENGEITVVGKTTHALEAEKGINAVVRLAEALAKSGKSNKMLQFIVEKANNPRGKGIFDAVKDDESGHLVFNLGLADFTAEKQTIGVDIRFPVKTSRDDIEALLKKAAEPYGISVEQFDYLHPLYVDVNTELVQKLMQAYQEVTGDMKSQPIATGGATYARSMDNIVAYGATLPGKVSTEHQVNERAVADELKTAMEVYIKAFELLVVEG
ncbi:MAG: Sapep family Mn(2+)-dependent dipeptidase [Christensenellaceae bacterium]|jgi:succinyl-diaminopimelate desuccinylase